MNERDWPLFSSHKIVRAREITMVSGFRGASSRDVYVGEEEARTIFEPTHAVM